MSNRERERIVFDIKTRARTKAGIKYAFMRETGETEESADSLLFGCETSYYKDGIVVIAL